MQSSIHSLAGDVFIDATAIFSWGWLWADIRRRPFRAETLGAAGFTLFMLGQYIGPSPVQAHWHQIAQSELYLFLWVMGSTLMLEGLARGTEKIRGRLKTGGGSSGPAESRECEAGEGIRVQSAPGDK